MPQARSWGRGLKRITPWTPSLQTWTADVHYGRPMCWAWLHSRGRHSSTTLRAVVSSVTCK